MSFACEDAETIQKRLTELRAEREAILTAPPPSPEIPIVEPTKVDPTPQHIVVDWSDIACG